MSSGKNCSKLRSVQYTPVCCVRARKGTAKQGKCLLEVISTIMLKTQEGENEGVHQDEDKVLVREREHKEIDNVMNCKRVIS